MNFKTQSDEIRLNDKILKNIKMNYIVLKVRRNTRKGK